jgi:hypothetical protein
MPISYTAAVDPRPPAAVGLSVGFAAIFAAFASAGSWPDAAFHLSPRSSHSRENCYAGFAAAFTVGHCRREIGSRSGSSFSSTSQ